MNWLYTLWYGYVWPSLKGNGPEAVVQTVVYAAVAVAVYPPLRKFIELELNHLHKKMDHIIEHHPAIPPLPKGRPKPDA